MEYDPLPSIMVCQATSHGEKKVPNAEVCLVRRNLNSRRRSAISCMTSLLQRDWTAVEVDRLCPGGVSLLREAWGPGDRMTMRALRRLGLRQSVPATNVLPEGNCPGVEGFYHLDYCWSFRQRGEAKKLWDRELRILGERNE